MKEDDKTIYIKVKSDGKVYKANSGKLELATCDEIIFELEQYQDVARVISKVMAEEIGFEPEDSNKVVVIRKLTNNDREKLIERSKEAALAKPLCQEKIKKHNLSMTVVDVDLSIDGKKLTFYFTSPGRVDFRTLVPDLASTFQKLIRLQQITSRDKAKYCGGYGRCGQHICCKRFLKGDLESVTLEMASEQNLGQMGSNRVMGVCGKLQCCLKYELSYYSSTKKQMPEVGEKIKTKDGEGIVKSQNFIKKTVVAELIKDKRLVEVSC